MYFKEYFLTGAAPCRVSQGHTDVLFVLLLVGAGAVSTKILHFNKRFHLTAALLNSEI